MNHPRHVTFWQSIGAIILVADVGIVALVILTHTAVDKFVLELAALPVVGAFALMRPEIVDDWVKRRFARSRR